MTVELPLDKWTQNVEFSLDMCSFFSYVKTKFLVISIVHVPNGYNLAARDIN